MIALCAAVGAIAWALPGNPQLLAIVAVIAGVFVVFLLGTWLFAHFHPDQAAVGGSEWIKFREMQMGSKFPLSINPPTTDPEKPLAPPPTLIERPDPE